MIPNTKYSKPITTTVRVDYWQEAQKRGIKMNYALNKGLRHILEGKDDKEHKVLLDKFQMIAAKHQLALTELNNIRKQYENAKEELSILKTQVNKKW